MKFTHVENMKYVAEDQTAIDCDVYFEDILGPTPFTANMYDSAPHGKEIFNAIVSGVYGPIEAYVPPPAPTEAPQPTVEGTQTL